MWFQPAQLSQQWYHNRGSSPPSSRAAAGERHISGYVGREKGKTWMLTSPTRSIHISEVLTNALVSILNKASRVWETRCFSNESSDFSLCRHSYISLLLMKNAIHQLSIWSISYGKPTLFEDWFNILAVQLNLYVLGDGFWYVWPHRTTMLGDLKAICVCKGNLGPLSDTASLSQWICNRTLLSVNNYFLMN